MVDRMPGIPEWNAGSGVQDLGVPRLAAWGPLAAKAGSGRVARMLEEAATDPHDAAAGDRPARSLRAAYRRLRRVKDARPAPPDALAVLDPATAAIRDLMPLGPDRGALVQRPISTENGPDPARSVCRTARRVA